MEPAAVQRRTLRLLFITQTISGIGVSVGASVGALLAAEIAGVGLSGLAQSASVVGAALFAVPATAIVQRAGRRPSLATGYFIAAIGAIVVVLAAIRGSVPLLFLGVFLFGCGNGANLQARYAAVDLSPPALRGRHLSLIVWATTVGAVIGPGLAPLAGATLGKYGIPTLAAPFFLSALLLAAGTLLLLGFLRPDPAVVARAELGKSIGRTPSSGPGMRAAFEIVRAEPRARLGVIAMAVGHIVMVGVMAMTPVHIRSAGHSAEHTLRIVGLVLSFHVAGMYAFSPIVGWLTDRVGRRPVVLGGIAVLLAACAIAGTAEHDSFRLAVGLMTLGLGWSGTMVAGSTMLSDSIAVELRPAAQGLSDLVMGLAGASAGALSGLVVETWGYPRLTLFAGLATVPLILLLSLSATRRPSPSPAVGNDTRGRVGLE